MGRDLHPLLGYFTHFHTENPRTKPQSLTLRNALSPPRDRRDRDRYGYSSRRHRSPSPELNYGGYTPRERKPGYSYQPSAPLPP